MTPRPLIAALTRDLMLETRLDAAAAAAGADLTVCAGLSELGRLARTSRPALVLVDLAEQSISAEGVIEALPAGARPALLGFYPHVRRELGDDAKRSGYDMVVPRSRFLSDTVAVLRPLLAGAATQHSAHSSSPEP